MRSLAVFCVKGGVGKSAIAVNLAFASAQISCRRTLLWDLDAQGAASYTLNLGPTGGSARKAIAQGDITALIQPSEVPNLDVLPADKSLRHLEAQLLDEKAKRLKKLLKSLEKNYDRIIIDCPPGLSELADQLFRAVDLLVVPLIPSPLSERAYIQLQMHLSEQHKHGPEVMPVFSMADRRKALHKAALAAHPDRPIIPYAATVENMASERLPLLASHPKTLAAKALASLWTEVERRLTC